MTLSFPSASEDRDAKTSKLAQLFFVSLLDFGDRRHSPRFCELTDTCKQASFHAGYIKTNLILAQWLTAIPTLSHPSPLWQSSRLQWASECELFYKPLVTHSLNSKEKAISKHRGLRMPSQRRGWGIPGLSGRYTMERLSQSALSRRWWRCQAWCGEALTRRGVKVRSWGGGRSWDIGGEGLTPLASTVLGGSVTQTGTPHRCGTQPHYRVNTTSHLLLSLSVHCWVEVWWKTKGRLPIWLTG